MPDHSSGASLCLSSENQLVPFRVPADGGQYAIEIALRSADQLGDYEPPDDLLWSFGFLSGRRRGGQEIEKALRILAEGFFIKSGDTYFRVVFTIIGTESLTTVFEMGTGVTFRL